MKYLASILVALGMLFAGTSTAFASHWYGYGDNDIDVRTHNSADVDNTAVVIANTGANQADGGNGLSRGGRNQGGNGGNGGNITTGRADALSDMRTTVNVNDTRVNADCGCRGDIDVRTTNNADIDNAAVVAANSGANQADGGNGDSRGWRSQGGNGGNGGNIGTGNAVATSFIVNSANHNTTRVVR